MTDDIKPALTAVQWEMFWRDVTPMDAELWVLTKGYDAASSVAAPGSDVEKRARHATAALCLEGQPFGFTWEDVREIRAASDGGDDPLERIADRIAALLPPR